MLGFLFLRQPVGGVRSKWDINWQVPRGIDQLYPWNCDKDTVTCFLNNYDVGDASEVRDDDEDDGDDGGDNENDEKCWCLN